MNECFFIKDKAPPFQGNGGGNIQSVSSLTVRRSLAIGDALCASVVGTKLASLGFNVTMQAHSATHCVLRRIPTIAGVAEPNGHTDVDLDGAYERDPARRGKHFHEMFITRANEQLARIGIDLGTPHNCKPHIRVAVNEREAALKLLSRYERPWTFICPRSDSFNVRQVPDGVWTEVAANLPGTKFWLGRHPAPKNIVDLKIQHFDHVIQFLSVADLMLSVDTGPLHVAAALGCPMIAVNQSSSPELHLNDQNDYASVSPDLECLNCQLNVCPKNSHVPPCQNINPERIWKAAKARLDGQKGDGVSALVSIYKPERDVLNRCLAALLPQVDEIIVAVDMAGQIPEGALTDPKISYHRKALFNIGFGRKMNFAARQSNHRALLIINDDCFLDPGAVAKMKEHLRGPVGMVSNLLRYPDGTIYHAGKARGPGQMGWGHIDHRHRDCTIPDVREMENVCGCCLLVSREAFYKIDGFDEDFFLYAEDDDFCLRMRRAGYKILFTPHSTGIHMEHQSTQKTADIMTLVNKANATFTAKWHPYLVHNANRIPGDFDY